jgi:C_GCAxxG_C_C family probable redox protein
MSNKTLEKRIIQLAAESFWKGFHCSEAVLIAMAGYIGVTSELIPKIATGFGGGIASSGSVCGALVGGVMAIGIKYGRSEVIQIKADQKTKNLARQFTRQFEKIAGSTLGYDITQCDFNTLEGLWACV